MSIIIRNDDVKGIERELGGKEQFTVWNALHVARSRYIEDAKHARELAAEAKERGEGAGVVAWERIASQFDTQVSEVDALAEDFG